MLCTAMAKSSSAAATQHAREHDTLHARTCHSLRACAQVCCAAGRACCASACVASCVCSRVVRSIERARQQRRQAHPQRHQHVRAGAAAAALMSPSRSRTPAGWRCCARCMLDVHSGWGVAGVRQQAAFTREWRTHDAEHATSRRLYIGCGASGAHDPCEVASPPVHAPMCTRACAVCVRAGGRSAEPPPQIATSQRHSKRTDNSTQKSIVAWSNRVDWRQIALVCLCA
jgi:hypothetical protein